MPELTADSVHYWTDWHRSMVEGRGDWVTARRLYEQERADLLVPGPNGEYVCYRLKPAYQADREAVRAFTRREHKGLFTRSMA